MTTNWTALSWRRFKQLSEDQRWRCPNTVVLSDLDLAAATTKQRRNRGNPPADHTLPRIPPDDIWSLWGHIPGASPSRLRDTAQQRTRNQQRPPQLGSTQYAKYGGGPGGDGPPKSLKA